MPDPITRAQEVLAMVNAGEIPALSLNAIASTQKITVLKKQYPNAPAFCGALGFCGGNRGIIINTQIDNIGRISFTFAHELGHHFLDHQPTIRPDGSTGFWCSTKDITDIMGLKRQETEANQFAAELLMPESSFRLQMAGAPIDFALIGGLSRHYFVSKQACAYRLVRFANDPCIVLFTSGLGITNAVKSKEAAPFQLAKSVHHSTAAFNVIASNLLQTGFSKSAASNWFQNAPTNLEIYEWTRSYGEGAMTILKIV